jgi:hypothetical protein
MNGEELGRLGELSLARREIRKALGYFQRELSAGVSVEKHLTERWVCWMLLGEFEEAWKESDRSETPLRYGPSPSNRVVIHCLRGLGDAIQFLRFLPQLRNSCSHITVRAPARLVPLLKKCAAIDCVESFENQWDSRQFDYEIECSDLPYLFRVDDSTIPLPDAHLPGLLRHRRGARSEKLKIGLVWGAGEWNPARSVPVSFLSPLADEPGISLFSLQRGSHAEGLYASPLRDAIEQLEREHGNILDTADALMEMNLLIAVDTMTAHLARVLGKPVWLMLPQAADWRWMLDRSESPWYPSMRLFRQRSPGDWESVVLDIVQELKGLMARLCVVRSQTTY